MQPCCHVTSSNQIDIILSLYSILNLWNKTNSPKNLHQHQLTTPEEDHQHNHIISPIILKTVHILSKSSKQAGEGRCSPCAPGFSRSNISNYKWYSAQYLFIAGRRSVEKLSIIDVGNLGLPLPPNSLDLRHTQRRILPVESLPNHQK